MMRSLFSGVSGLKNHQTRMDVIGNNISNVNTTGFKSSRVTFVDTLSQTLTGASAPKGTLGGTNPKQIGLGSNVGSIDLMFQDGSVQSTGKNTDLCLSGNGLFVVKQGNETFYTRDGAFEFDADGNYVLPGSGMFVQGWMGQDGNIDTTAATGNIVVQAGKSMAAKATSQVTYNNNLNADTPMIVELSGGGTTATATSAAPVTVTLSNGETYIETTGTYSVGESLPITTTVTMYDSLGGTHNIPIYFKREGSVTTDASGNKVVTAEDKWLVSLDINGTAAGSPSTYTFIEENGTQTTVEMNVVEIQFTTSGKYNTGTSSSGTATLTFTNGAIGTGGAVVPDPAAKQSVTVNFSALTQFSGNNTVVGKPDGNAAGTLKSVQIDSSGTITGVYTNGVRQAEAQVAVAQFTNASGLTKTGNSLYQESNNSGVPNVKTASDLGVTITPSALEMSNVDVANEFSDMIITQRGFQSNSKIVTVSDEMLETVINMKR
jgi:flagellar hook protein FlgE